MASVSKDVDALTSEPRELTLANGLEVKVERVRVRQLLKLLNIFANGASAFVIESMNEYGVESEEFKTSLLAALASAVPEAEDQTIAFISSLVVPKEYTHRPKSAAAKKVNARAMEELDAYMDNPEIEDLIEIFTVVIEVETPHIAQLVKNLSALVEAQAKNLSAKKQ